MFSLRKRTEVDANFHFFLLRNACIARSLLPKNGWLDNGVIELILECGGGVGEARPEVPRAGMGFL